jgi:hypothetical protein
MSAFKEKQLESLEKAIADGALTVKYSDKMITYRSLDEMIRIRDILRKDLGKIESASTRRKAEFSKGL